MVFLGLSAVVAQGGVFFSPEQQFNGIASTVATLFALLVFCNFRRCSFSSPHSSTLSRIFLFVLLMQCFPEIWKQAYTRPDR